MSLLRRPDRPPPAPTDQLEVLASFDDDESGDDVPIEPLDLARWAGLARAVLVEERVSGPAELGLAFVSERAIAVLNEEWMGERGPTDVLSFPLDAESADAEVAVPRLLGDVVLCPSVARRYAADNGRPVEDELALLVVHGVLHVLGHDHAESDEEALMQSREDHHLRSHHDPTWTRSVS